MQRFLLIVLIVASMALVVTAPTSVALSATTPVLLAGNCQGGTISGG